MRPYQRNKIFGWDASPRRPKTNFNCRQVASSTFGSGSQTRPPRFSD